MIQSRADYLFYRECDKVALGINRSRPKWFSDELWKFEILLRKREYWKNSPPLGDNCISKLVDLVLHYRFNRLSIKLGFSIPLNVFGPGLAIVHRGTIVVAGNAKIGENCRIHEGVTLGATNGSTEAPVLGNNIFIATGAKIIGAITISDDVAIGANAVVVKDVILPNGGTVGGIPAKLISNNTSSLNLTKATDIVRNRMK